MEKSASKKRSASKAVTPEVERKAAPPAPASYPAPAKIFDFMASATDDEKSLVQKFKAQMQEEAGEKKLELTALDPNFPLDDSTYLRFLRAKRGDLSEAVKLLTGCVQWRLKFKPHTVEEHWAAFGLAKGEVVEHGRDVDGCPVMWFFPAKHVDWSGKLEIYARGVIFLVERFMREVFIPTGTRSTLLWDLNGLGMGNLDYGFIKFAIGVFATAYPETLGRIIVLDAPWFFSAVWKIVKPWVDPNTAAKVQFCNRDKLKEHMHPDQVPKAWGGNEEWTFDWNPTTPGLEVPKSLDDYVMPDDILFSQ